MGRVAAALVAGSLAGCASVEAPPDDGAPRCYEALPGAERSEPLLGETAAKILFPVNVLPDIASNFLSFATLPVWIGFTDDPGNLWPFIWMTSPVWGVACGIKDAWHGYTFWDPVAFDEHRKY